MDKINVGTIGHVDHGKTMVTAALMLALANTAYEVVEPKPIIIRPLRGLDDPIFCRDIQRKSKGDKRRDRSERRRKWGI